MTAHSSRRQILDLAAVEIIAQMEAEIVHALGVAQQAGDPGAIGARVAARQIRRQPGPAALGRAQEALEIGIGNIAAGQGRRMGPGRPAVGEMRLQLLQRMLGQLAKGRDLAAEDRQQRGDSIGIVELEHIVASHRRGACRFVVMQRADAGIGPDHIGGRDLLDEMIVDDLAEIGDLLGRYDDLGGIALIGLVGGADQRMVAFIGNGEDDAPVVVLEDIGLLALEQPRDDDVAALDQTQPLAMRQGERVLHEARDPGAGGIDEAAGPDRPALPRRDILDDGGPG